MLLLRGTNNIVRKELPFEYIIWGNSKALSKVLQDIHNIRIYKLIYKRINLRLSR